MAKPIARFTKYWDYGEAMLLPALLKERQFDVQNEFGFQRIRTEQYDSKLRIRHCLMYFALPRCADGDVNIMPGSQQTMPIEDIQVVEKAILPLQILVAVADKDPCPRFR